MTTDIRSTKKFKALIAVGLSEDQALAQLGEAKPDEADANIARLVSAGYTETEAHAILNPSVEVVVETPKQVADLLVESRGLTHTRGLVRLNTEAIEAAVRVLKTGKPEVINSSDEGHVVALSIYRENNVVAVQNLVGGEK